MRPFRLSAAALTAIAIPTLGGFANPAGTGSLHDFTANAETSVHALIDRWRGGSTPAAIAKTNGRIEATQIDVSAKYPGRLEEVAVKEGDEVTAGQVLARISSLEYEAQLRGAQSQVMKAKQCLAEAEAQIARWKSEVTLAAADLARGRELVDKGWLTRQVFDQRVAKAETAEAGLRAAEAEREQADFAIKTAQSDVERIQAILADLVLLAPRSGRVQYQIAHTGEVVAAGSRVLTILDLNDVYMTIYLPAPQAGPLALGDQARIILDPLPQFVVPSTVSFVAADAQFTPKYVETTEERQKLMFRVKLTVDPQVLKKYQSQVKTGVRGMGFVRTDLAAAWPEDLVIKLPQ
jgi:HlyD family secretion protein